MEGSNYNPPDVINHFHNTPRFGFPSDVGVILLGTLSALNYASGLLFIPAMICIIFFVWTVLLIIFKFCCKGKIISGAHLIEIPTAKSKNRNCRIFVCLVTLVVILSCSVSLSTQTLLLRMVFDKARAYISEFQYIVKQIRDAAKIVVEAQENFENSRVIALSYIRDGICQDKDIDTEVDPTIKDIGQVLVELGDWSFVLDAALFEIENILNQTSNSLSVELSEVIDNAENYTNVSSIGMIIMLASSGMLMLGQLLAWFGHNIKLYFSIQKWVILPFFVISLSASVFMACFCAMVLVFNSDVCIGNELGNPEGLLKTIVQYDEQISQFQNLFDHYILNACLGDAILINDIKTIFEDTVIYNEKMQSFLTSFTPDTQKLIEYICANGVSLDDTFESLSNVASTTAALIPKTQIALDSVYCPTVNKMYRNISHDMICTQIPTIFGSMFWLVLCYIFFGMILFTFRGVLFPSLEKEERDYEEWEYDTQELTRNNDLNILGNSNVDFNDNKWSVMVGLKDSITGIAQTFLNRIDKHSFVGNGIVRRRNMKDSDEESKEEFLPPPPSFVKQFRDSIAGKNIFFINRTRGSLGDVSQVSSLGGESLVRRNSVINEDDKEENEEEFLHPSDVFKKLGSVNHFNIHEDDEYYDEYDKDNRSYKSDSSSHSNDHDEENNRSYSSDYSSDSNCNESRDSFHDNINQVERRRLTMEPHWLKSKDSERS